MRKFLAIVKREYLKVVVSWAFIIGTLLAPLMASLFAVVPMLIFSVKGNAVRLAVVDSQGKISARLRQNLSPEKVSERAQKATEESFKDVDATQEEKMQRGAEQLGESFVFEDYNAAGRSAEEIRRELSDRIRQDQLDAYLIVPENYIAPDAKFEFYSRNASDFMTNSTLKGALNSAVRSERLAAANISEERLDALGREVEWSVNKVGEQGEQIDNGSSFVVSFIIGLLIYLTLAIYGQAILGAVVEEKETRIAEILFSSAKPFQLMLGKLVGVGLAGLTQLAIWIVSLVILTAFGASAFKAAGFAFPMPNITPLNVVYFFIFFLLGFFIFATIYALIGAMVTTVQEGGQFAIIPVFILLGSLYCMFPVIRSPNSDFSFWVSIAPFVASIVMPIRILGETPPFWQIALSVALNLLTILGLVWFAARVYRVGMLMYGKRATIPEVWKWIRQS